MVLSHSTMPGLSQALAAQGVAVRHAPEHDLWKSPGSLSAADVVVLGSMHPSHMDVLIPLAARLARAAVCALVSVQYCDSPPSPRADFMRHLAKLGRLAVVFVPLTAHSLRNLTWLGSLSARLHLFGF
jgi:hypothetical protein